MANKPTQPRNWGTIMIERYPEYFPEIEDALRTKPDHELTIPLGDPEVAKSHRLKYYKFRRSLAQPQNHVLMKEFYPRTLKFEVLVRGGDLVFRDTELIYDKYYAVALGRPARGEAPLPPGMVKMKEVEDRQNARDATPQVDWEEYLRQARQSNTHPQEPPPPAPAPKSRAEDTEFWKRYPPIFQNIPKAVAQEGEWTVLGTSFAAWPKQWIEVQQAVGEPWSLIELKMNEKSVVFQWLPGFEPKAQGEPTEE